MGAKEALSGLARYRLEALNRARKETGFWTSALSPAEALGVQEAGGEILGQVGGSSVFQVNQLTGMYSRTGKLGSTGQQENLSEAYLGARFQAVERLEAQARLLGANVVVGVHVEVGRVGLSENLVRFSLSGTAIRVADWPEGPLATTTLSGQELWKLRRSGFRPCALVFGVCVYVVNRGFYLPCPLNMYNRELQAPTEGLQTAIAQAREQMEFEARGHQAQGVVATTVEVDLDHREWDATSPTVGRLTCVDFIVVCLAMGTAIFAAPVELPTPRPLLMMDLQAGKRRPLSVI